MDQNILTTSGLTKNFGKLAALSKLDINIKKGQIHGLIGPNGSGKSTFVNVVTGLLVADEGDVYFEGKDITNIKPNIISSKIGINRTFQIAQVLPSMTCLQNVMIGGHNSITRGFFGTLLRLPLSRLKQEEDLRQRCLELMQFVGLADFADRWSDDLGWTDCQLLQIARALVNKPKLLILDEPTSGMGIEESKKVAAIIEKVRDSGITVLVISHDMGLVMGIAEWITVLEFGCKIFEGTPIQVSNSPLVMEAYLGKE